MMMQTLLPDQLTPVTHDELIYGLRAAYPLVQRRDPLDAELATYFAQCLVENGARLQALHCFGLGNVKATASWDGYVVTYDCDETFDAQTAARARALAPQFCALTPIANGRVHVALKAGHPWAVFRAFESLPKACEAYIRIFTLPRYAQAVLRARAGDPVGFVEACAAGGYMTTPNVAGYAAAVASIASRATPACASAISGNSLGLTPDDVEHIETQVALGLAGVVDAMAFESFPLPKDEIA